MPPESLQTLTRFAARVARRLRRERRRLIGTGPDSLVYPWWKWPPDDLYEILYRHHVRDLPDEAIVGDATLFEIIGRLELGVLLMEGLRPSDTIVDLGCGTGRLAVHLVPRLHGGHYIGTEILDSILAKGRERVASRVPDPPCRLTWARQRGEVLPADDRSADMICAFSVFTHIEHEDAFRYLEDGLRVVKPGGKFIFSCLPMKHQVVYDIFRASAELDLRHRWSAPRNVTTSEDLMDAIATLAGWTVVRWYAGNANNIRLPDSDELGALGQSVCVLQAPGAA